MRAGRAEGAAAPATKIRDSIKQFNSAEFSRADVMADPKNMWAKVRQLTGRSKNRGSANSALSANELNNRYAAISTDADYQVPGIKSTVNTDQVTSHITEWRIF